MHVFRCRSLSKKLRYWTFYYLCSSRFHKKMLQRGCILSAHRSFCLLHLSRKLAEINSKPTHSSIPPFVEYISLPRLICWCHSYYHPLLITLVGKDASSVKANTNVCRHLLYTCYSYVNNLAQHLTGSPTSADSHVGVVTPVDIYIPATWLASDTLLHYVEVTQRQEEGGVWVKK